MCISGYCLLKYISFSEMNASWRDFKFNIQIHDIYVKTLCLFHTTKEIESNSYFNMMKTAMVLKWSSFIENSKNEKNCDLFKSNLTKLI